MNMNRRNRSISTLCILIFLGHISSVKAQAPSPLDVEQHPTSPRYKSMFPDQIVPLDTQLSWKNRFVGDESFNIEELLPPTSPLLEQLSISSGKSDSTSSSGFDTSGVVKQVKLSEGKVKIEHGPIERLGMPAMTMMFRVEEPDQLKGLDKGAEVVFNVDNTDAGFSITHLESSSGSFDATGIVKQVKSSDGKVKIEHGPIERLGMPAMTMMFRVEETSQLEGLGKGAEVAFNVDNTSAGFSITQIELVGGSDSKRFDANGMVKSIRTAQGKIKIEHGPIDRLGMPAMTMMFKVKDLDDLNALEKNMQVEFDVANGPGGFEITRIKPVSEMKPESAMAKVESRVCYTVGPFYKRTKVDLVNRRYQENGIVTKLSSTTDREYVGDMIYIESQESRQAALDIGNKLKQSGISDTMILNEPGKRNALSLGVYSQKQNAMRIKTEVEAMNIPVKFEARYRTRTLYWLHNEQLDPKGPLDLLTADDIESGIRQTINNCKFGEGA